MQVEKVSIALAIVALLIGASGLALTVNLQAQLSSASSAVGDVNKNLGALSDRAQSLSTNVKALADANGVPLGNPQQLQQLIELRQIIEGAKKEGKLVVYGTIESDIMKKVFATFESTYPFLKVEYWRASSSSVLDRALIEVKAGKAQFDVVHMSPYLLNIIKQERAFAKYVPPEAANYPKELLFDPEYLISPIFVVRPIGIVFNTRLLKATEAPKSLMELLDPKWKGKLVIPDPAQHPTTTDWLASLKGVKDVFRTEAEWEAWIKGLAKNEPVLEKSFLPAVERVVKGEKPMAITYIRYVIVYSKAPLDYVGLSPSLGNVNSAALNAKAVHPNAAKLYINFLLSKQGQQALADAGDNVALPGIYPPLKDIEKIKAIPLSELSKDEFKKWSETFHKWITGAA